MAINTQTLVEFFANAGVQIVLTVSNDINLIGGAVFFSAKHKFDDSDYLFMVSSLDHITINSATQATITVPPSLSEGVVFDFNADRLNGYWDVTVAPLGSQPLIERGKLTIYRSVTNLIS